MSYIKFIFFNKLNALLKKLIKKFYKIIYKYNNIRLNIIINNK
jgi:hypothetical protein